jgi:hypothetical protein
MSNTAEPSGVSRCVSTETAATFPMVLLPAPDPKDIRSNHHATASCFIKIRDAAEDEAHFVIRAQAGKIRNQSCRFEEERSLAMADGGEITADTAAIVLRNPLKKSIL